MGQGGWGRETDRGGWAGGPSGGREQLSFVGRALFLLRHEQPGQQEGPAAWVSLLAQPLLDPEASGRLQTELAHSTRCFRILPGKPAGGGS